MALQGTQHRSGSAHHGTRDGNHNSRGGGDGSIHRGAGSSSTAAQPQMSASALERRLKQYEATARNQRSDAYRKNRFVNEQRNQAVVNLETAKARVESMKAELEKIQKMTPTEAHLHNLTRNNQFLDREVRFQHHELVHKTQQITGIYKRMKADEDQRKKKLEKQSSLRDAQRQVLHDLEAKAFPNQPFPAVLEELNKKKQKCKNEDPSKWGIELLDDLQDDPEMGKPLLEKWIALVQKQEGRLNAAIKHLKRVDIGPKERIIEGYKHEFPNIFTPEDFATIGSSFNPFSVNQTGGIAAPTHENETEKEDKETHGFQYDTSGFDDMASAVLDLEVGASEGGYAHNNNDEMIGGTENGRRQTLGTKASPAVAKRLHMELESSESLADPGHNRPRVDQGGERKILMQKSLENYGDHHETHSPHDFEAENGRFDSGHAALETNEHGQGPLFEESPDQEMEVHEDPQTRTAQVTQG